jgi:CheY-like chemotaxis protein
LSRIGQCQGDNHVKYGDQYDAALHSLRPAPLSLLRGNGYRVLTATNGQEGLQLFMTRQVDAIVLEYHLGSLDGGVVAAEIKKTRPQIPMLMVVDHLDVPEAALRSADMVVAKFDGDNFLLSAVRSLLEAKPLSPDKTERAAAAGPRLG